MLRRPDRTSARIPPPDSRKPPSARAAANAGSSDASGPEITACRWTETDLNPASPPAPSALRPSPEQAQHPGSLPRRTRQRPTTGTRTPQTLGLSLAASRPPVHPTARHLERRTHRSAPQARTHPSASHSDPVGSRPHCPEPNHDRIARPRATDLSGRDSFARLHIPARARTDRSRCGLPQDAALIIESAITTSRTTVKCITERRMKRTTSDRQRPKVSSAYTSTLSPRSDVEGGAGALRRQLVCRYCSHQMRGQHTARLRQEQPPMPAQRADRFLGSDDRLPHDRSAMNAITAPRISG